MPRKTRPQTAHLPIPRRACDSEPVLMLVILRALHPGAEHMLSVPPPSPTPSPGRALPAHTAPGFASVEVGYHFLWPSTGDNAKSRTLSLVGSSPPTPCHPQKCPVLLALSTCVTCCCPQRSHPERINDDDSDNSLSTHYLLAALLCAIMPPSNPGRGIISPI